MQKPLNTSRPPRASAVRQAWTGDRSLARHARTTGDRTRERPHPDPAHHFSQPFAIAPLGPHPAMLDRATCHCDRHHIGDRPVRLLLPGRSFALERYQPANARDAAASADTPISTPTNPQAIVVATATVTS